MKDIDELIVSVDVTNTGNMSGKEVVQLYVADKISTVIRPEKELRDFAKVELKPGEKKTIQFVLGKRAFAYWNIMIHDWHVESGEFEILIGKSSRDIVLKKTVEVTSTRKLPVVYTLDTTFGDIMEDQEAKDRLLPLMNMEILDDGAKEEDDVSAEAISKEMRDAMIKYMPVRGVLSFGGKCTLEELENALEQLNRRV
jgi:beta-glucosidase